MVMHGDGGNAHDLHDGAGGHGAYSGHGGRPPRGFAATFLIPLAIPVIATVIIFTIIWSVSRILLAMPGNGATPIAIVIAIAVLLLCAVVASAPKISKATIYAVIAVPLLAVWGAGIGSGIYLHNEKPESAAAKLTPLPAQEITTDNQFSATSLTFAAGAPITINLKNNGQAVHNFFILDSKDASGNDIKSKNLAPGDADALTFTINQPGTYHFQCQFHPTQMTGTITIVAAGGEAGAGGAPGQLAETTTDDKFSATSFAVDRGTKVTLTLTNNGSNTHNWALQNATNADGSPIKTDIIEGGKTTTISFQIDQPGAYPFICQVHPTVMKGTLTVK